MKIRTQFIISTLIFGLVLLVMAAALVITNQRLQQINRQEGIAASLQQEANELGYLSNDYLIYQENQQLTRWEAKFSSVSNDLSTLRPGTQEQQVTVNNIQTNQQQLAAVFADVRAALEKTAQSQGTSLDPVFIRTSWSRMEVQTQSMIFNASRLLQLLNDQEDQLKLTMDLLMFVLVGIFGVFVLGNYFLNYQRTIKSIAVLQSGTKIIGSGNLDYAIPEKGKDEISDLSRAFNHMSASLKTVTASRAELEFANTELEREIVERKRAQEQSAYLASYPELNPNPIADLRLSGEVTYLNPAAKGLFPDLSVGRTALEHAFL